MEPTYPKYFQMKVKVEVDNGVDKDNKPKTKKITEIYLVHADNMEEAIARLRKEFSKYNSDYEIVQNSVSNVVDVIE